MVYFMNLFLVFQILRTMIENIPITPPYTIGLLRNEHVLYPLDCTLDQIPTSFLKHEVKRSYHGLFCIINVITPNEHTMNNIFTRLRIIRFKSSKDLMKQ